MFSIDRIVFSHLTVSVLPDGGQYEWQLCGVCKSSTTLPVEERPALLCNKPALNWAGVAVGESRQQKLILRNNSDKQQIHLNMSISSDHSNFQIQHNFLLQQKGMNKCETVLKPQGEIPVHLLFIPSCFAMANSSLVLRVVNGSTKFVIPLSGYGGCSVLDINGAKKLNDQFWIDMGDVYLGKKNVIKIVLRNSGTRVGYVSMKCFSGSAYLSKNYSTCIKTDGGQLLCFSIFPISRYPQSSPAYYVLTCLLFF